MFTYKLIVVLSEGFIFGMISMGLYVAFQWLRFPDLTPDGSFSLGAVVYSLVATSGFPPLGGVVVSAVGGMIVGSCTALVNRLGKIPSVVAGLLVASAMYSINWLLLGKPNQFLSEQQTLIGGATGQEGALVLLVWILIFSTVTVVFLHFFGGTVWGLRARAIGENRLLAQDIGASLTCYSLLCLSFTNGIVAVAGALFAHRSFSADINMGIGITISGLAGMMLGLLIAHKTRKIWLTLVAIMFGSFVYRGLVFLVLELGVPGQSFRLVSAIFLLVAFAIMRKSSTDFLRGLKWS